MKVVIIDDEKEAIRSIEISLKEYCPEVRVEGTAQSAKEGLKVIADKKPDLVFLDIQMPHMSGLEFLESINERSFEVIFVTAFSDHAIKAFKLNAVDYLLKPLNILELINAVKRASSRMNDQSAKSEKSERLKASLSGKIALPSSDGTEYVRLSDIIRLEADGSYTKVVIAGGKSKLVSKNLKEFEEILEGDGFFRTHKSHLINIEHIKKYTSVKDGGVIEMADGSTVEVSRTQKGGLSSLLGDLYK